MAAIGQLAGGVAHEINNPLSVILGFAQGAERRLAEEDPIRRPIQAIVREAERCKNIVRELLVFSRTSKNEHLPTDLNEVVHSTAILLRSRAKTQRITVSTKLVVHPAVIEGNVTQLQQVVVNLGNNAMDAMPSGGTLTLRTLEDPEQGLVLEVADTGTGIPAEIRARIFEPFFTTKEVGKGTGLGLSLVWEIVEQHGGRVEVESHPDQGTTVRIYFPE
jgi:signal transduction histidine kinase